MAKVELKQPIVQEIADQIDGAQSVVVVDYRGLTVSEDTQLRKELREAGVSYKVYKNTLMNFAFKGTDFEALAPVLEGPNAIAISKEDATAPARILANFAIILYLQFSIFHLFCFHILSCLMQLSDRIILPVLLLLPELLLLFLQQLLLAVCSATLLCDLIDNASEVCDRRLDASK